MIGVAYLLGETKLAYLASKAGDDEAEPGDVDDESTPHAEGHNPGDRSRDGPD